MTLARRLPLLGVLGVALLLLVVVGPGSAPSGAGDFGRALAGFAMPQADEPEVVSSTWYCAAGAADGGDADLSVVVANPLDDARRGTVTWFAGDEQRAEPVQVGARDLLVLRAADTVAGPQASAVVEIEGGGVAVEHRLSGPAGTTVAPCASAPSTTWHLANGSTARDARQQLHLFNPFPDDAVVDITFAVDGPAEAPPGLQGLAVPPRSTTVVDAGEHVLREDVTAFTVSARSGRLVVDRVQSFTGEGGRTGLSLALAAPAPATSWSFAGGRVGPDVTQRWHVYNPNEQEAVVVVEIVPDSGTVPEPVERTVRGGSSVVVVADEVPLLDQASGFSAVVRSRNDVAVVAEREIDGRPPAPDDGWSSALGAPRTAERWLLPAGMASATMSQTVSVANPTSGPVQVSVALVGDGSVADVPDAAAVGLGPAERIDVAVGAGRDGRPVSVLVEADGRVVVERHLDRLDGPGIDASVGIPLR